MKTTIKKTLAVLLTLCMIFALLPTFALADGETPSGTALTAAGGALTTGSYYVPSNLTLTAGFTIAAGNTVTIDLNGHTISYSGTTITNSGTLTVNDTPSGGGVSGATAISISANSANTIINAGTYTAENNALNITGPTSGTAPKATINGGTFTTTSTSDAAVYVYKFAELTIAGGTISGAVGVKASGMYNPSYYATLNISNATVTGTVTDAIYAKQVNCTIDSGKYTGNDYAINVQSCAAITLSGGYYKGGTETFNDPNSSISIASGMGMAEGSGDYAGYYQVKDPDFTVTFMNDANTTLCSNGFFTGQTVAPSVAPTKATDANYVYTFNHLATTVDGTTAVDLATITATTTLYAVYDSEERPKTVQIGETQYADTYYAIASIADSTQTTLTLIADLTEDVVIPAGKNIILDLDGHKITAATIKSNSNNEGTITVKGTLTIQDGTLAIRADDVDFLDAFNGNTIVVVAGGTLTKADNITVNGARSAIYASGAVGTIQNCNFTNLYYEGVYLASSGSTTTLRNNTVTIENNNNAVYAFTAVGLVIESGAYTAKGSGYAVKCYNAYNVTISGGTFASLGSSCVYYRGSSSSYSLNISGGSFTGANYALYVYSGSKANVTGGAFNAETTISNSGTCTLSGGYFKSTAGAPVFSGTAPVYGTGKALSAVAEASGAYEGYYQVRDTLTVTWKNGETSLATDTVAYGDTLTNNSYTLATPAKADSGDTTYTFSGWSPAFAALTADATYTALFSAKYTPSTASSSVTVPDVAYDALSDNEITATTTDGTAVSGTAVIPAAAVASLDETASLKVTTDVGSVVFDAAALDAVKTNAGENSSVTLKVEKIATNSNVLKSEQQSAVADAKAVISVEMVTTGDTPTEVFSSSNAGENSSVTVVINYTATSGTMPKVYYVADDGTKTSMNSVYNATAHTLTFTAPHFSEYAVFEGTPETSEFSVALVPTATNMHRDNAAIDAGDAITYNIVLTQTKVGDEAFITGGAVQTMDVRLTYDANLTYSSSAVSASYPGVTLSDTDGVLRILQTGSSNAFDITDGQPVTLGTVTFTTPNAATVRSAGANGVYDITTPTVSGMVVTSGAEGAFPTVSAGTAVSVYDVAVTYPTFTNFTMDDDLAATTLASGTATHYTLDQLESGVTVTMTAGTGYSVSAFSLNANASGESATGNLPTTPAGDFAVTGTVAVRSYALTVSLDADSTGGATASNIVFTPGTGVGGSSGAYTVSTATPASFTVTGGDLFDVTAVAYKAAGAESWTPMTADNGVYTIPGDADGGAYEVRVTLALSASTITYSVKITDGENPTYARYSVYSGAKSLVLFKAADGVAGISLSNGVTVYATSAYGDDYTHAALIDLTDVTVGTSSFNTYMVGIVSASAAANTSLTYNKDVNGRYGFMIDDVSIEYDFTRLSALIWVPTDAGLLIGDVAGNGTETPDGYLDSYDVTAFVAAYH